MPLSPVPVTQADLVERSEALEMLAAMADQTAAKALAPRSKDAYAADWASFTGWCERYGLTPLPAEPETVRLWLTDLSLQVAQDGGFRYSPASMKRFLSSIARAHRDAGLTNPCKDGRVLQVLAGIRRDRGTAQKRARPLLTADMIRLDESLEHHRWPSGFSAARDSFAMWLAYTTALRRESVADLDIGDISLPPDGMHVRLRRSKTDQEGKGAVLGVPYGTTVMTCVPCKFIRWVRLAEAETRAQRMRLVLAPATDEHICRGAKVSLDKATPLIRRIDKSGRLLDEGVSGAALNDMLKRRVVGAGYDPRGYSFHSLRSGFVTEARRNGADARGVRLQSLHSSDAMVDVYDREYLPLTENNAVWKLGL